MTTQTGVLNIEHDGSDDDRARKIRATIEQVLRDLIAEGCDAIVLFAAVGDNVRYRYVGVPADIWNLAHQGHDHVLKAFELDAAKPVPGQRLN